MATIQHSICISRSFYLRKCLIENYHFPRILKILLLRNAFQIFSIVAGKSISVSSILHFALANYTGRIPNHAQIRLAWYVYQNLGSVLPSLSHQLEIHRNRRKQQMDAVYSIASAKCLLDQNNGSDKLFIKEFNNSLHLHRMVEHHSTEQSEQESVLGSVGYMLINSFLRAGSHGVMNPSPASTHMKFNRIYYTCPGWIRTCTTHLRTITFTAVLFKY